MSHGVSTEEGPRQHGDEKGSGDVEGFAGLRQHWCIGREGLKAAWRGGELEGQEPQSIDESPCGKGPVGTVP